MPAVVDGHCHHEELHVGKVWTFFPKGAGPWSLGLYPPLRALPEVKAFHKVASTGGSSKWVLRGRRAAGQVAVRCLGTGRTVRLLGPHRREETAQAHVGLPFPLPQTAPPSSDWWVSPEVISWESPCSRRPAIPSAGLPWGLWSEAAGCLEGTSTRVHA